MKVQQTVLAISLGLITFSLQAAVVIETANPVQVTEGLHNTKFIYNPVVGANNVANLVQAPVYGELATANSTTTIQYYANNYLPTLANINTADGVQRWIGIDLGSQQLLATGQAGNNIKYDVFRYTGPNGTDVYRFQNPITGEYTGYFVKEGNNLVPYTGTVDASTLQKGGQIDGRTGSTAVTGYENKVVNGEHVLYGYQGTSLTSNGGVDGYITNPDGSLTRVSGDFVNGANTITDVRYVQSGILANTGTYLAGQALDPSKNIYGVSARDNDNVVMMTGNGVALADLSNKGVLQTDGSVVDRKLVSSTLGGVQKTREYTINGKTVIEIYNDDAGRELASKYYEVGTNGSLTAYSGTTPTAGTHIRTGTGEYTEGVYDIAKVHNTVTNKNVTYKESVQTVNQQVVQAAITNPDGSTQVVSQQFNQNPVKTTEQYVSTGVIGTNDDKSNKYGLEVVKVDGDKKESTIVTASGITTTGVINAADYQIGGISIVDNINSQVGSAVTNATKKIDEKIAEVDLRITQFNKTATQLNNRIDDVEKTSYRGVAIALAAQQQIPNIGAGQFAVFGGAGHYKGESAGAVGIANVFADGRTSLSAALGFAGGNEVGGRVGVSYVFGGK